MRSARFILSCAVISGLIMLISCGDDGSDVVDSGCWINFGIDTPTYEDIYETQESSIDLGGLLPTPGGILYSSDCPYDPGYTITWHNADNGESGTGGAWTIQKISFFLGHTAILSGWLLIFPLSQVIITLPLPFRMSKAAPPGIQS